MASPHHCHDDINNNNNNINYNNNNKANDFNINGNHGQVSRDAQAVKPLDLGQLKTKRDLMRQAAKQQLKKCHVNFDEETCQLFGLTNNDQLNHNSDQLDDEVDNEVFKENLKPLVDVENDKSQSKLDKLKIEDLDFGLGYSNQTFFISDANNSKENNHKIPDSDPKNDEDSKRLAVIRMYSHSLNNFLDRDAEVDIINKAFNLDIGPKIIFSSSKALCTQYIDSFILPLDDISQPNALKLVAQTIAIFNSNSYMSHGSNSMFKQMRKYLNNFGCSNYEVYDQIFSIKHLFEIVDFLEQLDAIIFTHEKFDMCINHGDTNPTNILFSHFNSKQLYDDKESFEEFKTKGAKCYLVDYELWFMAANIYDIASFLYLISGFPREYPKRYIKDKELLRDVLSIYIAKYKENRHRFDENIDLHVSCNEIDMYMEHLPYASLVFSFQTVLFQSLFYLSKKTSLNASISLLNEKKSFDALYEEIFGHKDLSEALAIVKSRFSSN